MTKPQIATIGIALISILVMYFGCETKPDEQKELEKTRTFVAESTDISVLLADAKSALTPAQSGEILALEEQLEAAAANDEERVALFKKLSGRWYTFEQPAIAGYYAQQVAEIENTEESWAIAGTTYAIGVKRSADKQVRDYCKQRGVKAFENAISINPDEVAHRVNLATIYTDAPPEENPMKGIQMLLELNNSYPDNVLVLTTLGRLAIQTGQYDRAVARLEKVVDKQPDNLKAICLLADAYQGLGASDKADTFKQKCEAGLQ